MSSLGCSTKKRKLMKNKKQKEKKESFDVLSSDVLHLITKKILDINDLFSFGQVCKNWRTIHSRFYWCDFMASDSPLILQKTPQAKKSCFFYNIPNGTTYNTMVPCFSGFSLAGFSSGYMILIGPHSTLLINPFARKVKKIPTLYNLFKVKPDIIQATLAFEANLSQEFILVILSRSEPNMLVYQSRISDWAVYSRSDGRSRNVIDVVVFQNTIYAITEDCEIGVLMLNSQRLKILNLKNKPNGYGADCFKLVSSDDQLLVLDNSRIPFGFKVYMIDLWIMTWIKLETLGDRSLFLAKYSKCYSLSNPSKWGFRSDCLYCISCYSSECEVSFMDTQVFECISIPENPVPTAKAKVTNVDWCFRRRFDVVDLRNLLE